MYETFKVPGIYIANPAFLSLYGAGKFTGVSIDSGENITMINTFFEGRPFSISRLNLAGKDLTEYNKKGLLEKVTKFSTTAEEEVYGCIKEKAGYVALDFEEELKYVEPLSYELPD